MRAAQLVEAATDPGLDGAERQLQLLRKLRVTEVAQVGEAQDLALAAVQLAQALVQGPRLFAGLRGVRRTRHVRGQGFADAIEVLHGIGPFTGAATQEVEPAAAHDHPHPGEGRTQGRLVLAGRTPDGQEGFLQHVLGPVPATGHPQGQAEQLGGRGIVEGAQGQLALAGLVSHRVEQRDQRGFGVVGGHGRHAPVLEGEMRLPRVRSPSPSGFTRSARCQPFVRLGGFLPRRARLPGLRITRVRVHLLGLAVLGTRDLLDRDAAYW